jgi:hypothetical protein
MAASVDTPDGFIREMKIRFPARPHRLVACDCRR